MRNRIIKLGLICLTIVAAACLVVRLLAPAWFGFPAYASVETICPGDVNHDEQRDIRDVVAIQAHILGKKTLAGELLVVADVNQDNQVDVLDIVRLIQHITRRRLLVDCKGTMAVTPASLDFGQVRVGTTKDLSLSVSNTGNRTLQVTGLASDNPLFSATSPQVPFDLAPGANRSVTIRYAPSAVASHSGVLTVSATSAGTALNASVALSGSGLIAANPAPVLTRITPSSATAGAAGLTITAEGTDFVNGSVVQWDGSNRPTTFVSATQLQAAITPADLAQEDVAVVRVVSPAPGGGASDVQYFTISRASNPQLKSPFLRYIAPQNGPTNTQFTLFGRGFSPTLVNNHVTFFKPGSTVDATLLSSNETTIVGRVPAGLAPGLYFVNVKVGDKSADGLQFEVKTTSAFLTLRPGYCFLLMPPGSGKEYLIVGGGTPPYKLKPLDASMQAFAKLEMKGTVIEVTGLSAGPYGATDITVQVEDSASPPSTDSTTVRIQTPRFDPTFDAVPHSLLPGSAPGFTFRIETNYGDLRTDKVRIKIEKAETNFTEISEKKLIALSGSTDIVEFTQLDSPTKASFDIIHRWPAEFEKLGKEGLEKIGMGFCEAGGIVVQDFPVPEPEAVVGSGNDAEFFVMDELFRLISTPNETFNITAVFTSVIPSEAGGAPLVVTKTKRFTTASQTAGSPQISTIRPDRCEVGREVTISGSGFGSTPASNTVTFTAIDGKRVPAVVKSATPDRLAVCVPAEASNGVVRVEVAGKPSNPHEFWVLFRPRAECGLGAVDGTSARRVFFSLEQPSDDVAAAKITLVLGEGSISTSQLTAGSQVGTVTISDGSYGDAYVILYAGQESTGARRHLFEMKVAREYSNVEAQLFLSPNAGGAGITLEMTGSRVDDAVGGQLYVTFDKPWYVPPAGATIVNFQMDVLSTDWTFYENAPLLVRRAGEIAP